MQLATTKYPTTSTKQTIHLHKSDLHSPQTSSNCKVSTRKSDGMGIHIMDTMTWIMDKDTQITRSYGKLANRPIIAPKLTNKWMGSTIPKVEHQCLPYFSTTCTTCLQLTRAFFHAFRDCFKGHLPPSWMGVSETGAYPGNSMLMHFKYLNRKYDVVALHYVQTNLTVTNLLVIYSNLVSSYWGKYFNWSMHCMEFDLDFGCLVVKQISLHRNNVYIYILYRCIQIDAKCLAGKVKSPSFYLNCPYQQDITKLHKKKKTKNSGPLKIA